MEAKINIAEILKDKKNGLRLYSPIFGECIFCYVREDTNDICVKKHNGVKELFDSKGLYYNTGEVMLFPSKSMRDWEKLSWKRGDVLIGYCGFVCIFKEWASDDYTRFNGCYFDGMPNAQTAKYRKLDNNTAYGYIRELEKRCGGVLNIKTLEIEKQIEFKDGDIVTMHKKNCDIVFIFNRLRTEGSFYYYAFHTLQTNNTGVIDCHITLPYAWTFFGSKMNFATDSEKQQLFDALAKEGKAWDAEKKQIVDLKEYQFKPFDKVLGRNEKGEVWEAELFSNYREGSQYPFRCIGFSRKYCIPYNEETAHLLGTTDDWEE